MYSTALNIEVYDYVLWCGVAELHSFVQLNPQSDRLHFSVKKNCLKKYIHTYSIMSIFSPAKSFKPVQGSIWFSLISLLPQKIPIPCAALRKTSLSSLAHTPASVHMVEYCMYHHSTCTYSTCTYSTLCSSHCRLAEQISRNSETTCRSIPQLFSLNCSILEFIRILKMRQQ